MTKVKLKRFVKNFKRLWEVQLKGIIGIGSAFLKIMTGDFETGFSELKSSVTDFGKDVWSEMQDLFGGAGADSGKFFNDNIQATDFSKSEELWKQAGAKFGEVFKGAFKGAAKPDAGLPEIVTPDVAGIADQVDFGAGITSGIIDAEEAFENLSTIGQGTANAISSAFSSAFSVIGSEFGKLWDSVFGEATSVFQKVAKAFVTSMISALAQVAAQFAASAVISLLFPSLGGFKSVLGLIAHDGGQVPALHSGGLARSSLPSFDSGGMKPDERIAKVQAGEYVNRRSSVNAQTLPVLQEINQTGQVPQGGGNIQIGRANISVNGVITESQLQSIEQMVNESDARLAERIKRAISNRHLTSNDLGIA